MPKGGAKNMKNDKIFAGFPLIVWFETKMLIGKSKGDQHGF